MRGSLPKPARYRTPRPRQPRFGPESLRCGAMLIGGGSNWRSDGIELTLGDALLTTGILSDYLDYSRQLVLDEIRAIVPADRRDTGGLYRLMLDYPLRYGKSLRPALSIAVCRAYGGSLS